MASNEVRETTASGSALPQLKGKKATALVAAMTLLVLVPQLSSTMFAPAIPSIAATLAITPALASQVLSLFLLTGAIAGVVLTRWSDFLGQRRTIFILLAAFGVGSLLCIWSPNLTVLLVGRALQGAASAAFPLSFIVLKKLLTPKTFGLAVGTLTAINGGVAGVDAYFSGLLVETFGFRSIFVVIFLVAIAATIAVSLCVPADSHATATGKMDWWGAATLSLGLLLLIAYLGQAPTAGWTSPISLGCLVAAVVAFVAFWNIEKRRSFPLIETAHLRSRHVWPVIATTIFSLAGFVGAGGYTIVLLSQDANIGYGMDAAQSALMYIVPGALAGVLVSPLVGSVAHKFGWLRLLRSGLALTIVLLVAVTLLRHNPTAIFFLMLLLGAVFTGIVLTNLNGLGVLLSPDDAPSALPGLNSASFGIGAGLGIGVVASFVNGTESGYVTAMWLSAGFAVLGLVASLCITPKAGQKL